MKNKNHVVTVTSGDLKRMNEQLEMVFMKTNSNGHVEGNEGWQIHEKNIELKDLIGRGSFASVHKGIYHIGEDSVDVAVKVFDWGEESNEPDTIALSRKTILHEVSIWCKLEHPNIAKLFGAINNKAGHYGEIQRLENNGLLVMEYIPSGTLKSYVIEHSYSKLPFEVVMQFALGLARGLSYLHSKKIVHRNVKPENILLDEKLNVKLTNFKAACFMPASDEYKLTGVSGTMGYMAPEVFLEIPYDHKCDVYSFGICLWEIYCCEEPTSVYNKQAMPRVPRSCQKSLGKVLTKCWEEDPKSRPEMREVVEMLEAIDVSKGRGMPQDESPSLLCACGRVKTYR